MSRSAQKRQRGNLRKSARLQFLDKVTAPFGKCHWCRATIVWLQRIPEGWAIEPAGHEKARVFRGTKKISELYLLATIDHVEGLASGGGNHPLNLVASCSPCNAQRGRRQWRA